MPNYVRNMMKDAISAGFKVRVLWDGELGYFGDSIIKANKAVNAVEEACVCIIDVNDPDGDPILGKSVGSAMIVNGLEDDERIANTDENGFCDHWMRTNVH